MLRLDNIRKHPKSTHRKKVVGRGLGSGHGTFSTRGGKGQTARTGHSKLPARFEGGRTPLIRQLPKSRGFRAITAKATIVSLDKLEVFESGAVIDKQALVDKGVIGSSKERVKILSGKVSKPLHIKLPISASAKELVQKAGGSVK